MEFLDPSAWSAALSTVWGDMHESGYWVSVAQIIWINILLSGDNAVVIALACLNLPAKVRFWGMTIGAGVAILMRVFFTLIISTLMTLPYLKIFGGVALFYIATKLLVPEDEGAKDEIHASERLWSAIRVIAVADVIMSLDNVIAIAAAAEGHTDLYVFGLAASIPLIVAGARIVMGLLTRYPVLIWAGGALLGWIAGQVILTDPVIRDYLRAQFNEHLAHNLEYAAAAAGAIFVVFAGWMLRRGREAPQGADLTD
jgi:YjbE family integral membrane protein